MPLCMGSRDKLSAVRPSAILQSLSITERERGVPPAAPEQVASHRHMTDGVVKKEIASFNSLARWDTNIVWRAREFLDRAMALDEDPVKALLELQLCFV